MDVASKYVEQLLTTLEGLPEKDVPIVIRFIEFLKWSERQRWADFDRWAMELARGFEGIEIVDGRTFVTLVGDQRR